MFGLGITSSVEHTFVAKQVHECNLQMGHVVCVGRGTHIWGVRDKDPISVGLQNDL